MNRSRTFRVGALGCSALAALSALFTCGAFASDTILHNFTGGASDGSQPYGSLTLSGSTLYGMTSGGGSGGGDGTIFSMNVSGSGFNLLHSFNGFDGAFPMGSLYYTGFGNLYGMTLGDNTNTQGTIFTISPSGTNFGLLHTFTGSTTDGGRPFGSLLGGVSGMTSSGGSANDGVTFSMNSNGTNFNVTHSFTGGSSDGMGPVGSLTSFGALYGMTRYGGSSNEGTIFSFGGSGGYTVVHNFTGGVSDGNQPFGNLTIISGQTLIGMTEQGGSSGKGMIFEVSTTGIGFTVLHNFIGGAGDGAFPLGSLTQYGSKFFGTTENGGSTDDGVVFSMNIDGSGFTLLHSFAGGTSDGANPQGDVTLSSDNKTLYGTTLNGGSAGDGVAFSVPSGVPEPASAGLCALGGLLLAARRRR